MIVLIVALLLAGSASAGSGQLTIQKRVTDGNGPDAGVFSFNPSWSRSFNLSAGEERTFSLEEGVYSFSETLEPGYNFLGIECKTPQGEQSFDTPGVSVGVQAGQTSVCTSSSQPQIDIGVEPEITANAALSVRRRCPPSRVRAEVRSIAARKVLFYINGRLRKTLTGSRGDGRYRLLAKVPENKGRVKARVEMRKGYTPQRIVVSRAYSVCKPSFSG